MARQAQALAAVSRVKRPYQGEGPASQRRLYAVTGATPWGAGWNTETTTIEADSAFEAREYGLKHFPKGSIITVTIAPEPLK